MVRCHPRVTTTISRLRNIISNIELFRKPSYHFYYLQISVLLIVISVPPWLSRLLRTYCIDGFLEVK